VDEIGLFPLGIVLLPGERVPLHIFEPRYRELIGECIETQGEFGLIYADESSLRDIGTRARVVAVLEQYDDGRMDIVVEGVTRFRVGELTEGRSFWTARVGDLSDDDPEPPTETDETLALGAYRALAQVVEPEADEPEPGSPGLAFALAGRVELAPEDKQNLLELRSERARLRLVAELIDAAGRMVVAQRDLAERAAGNGKRH
jgi:Lon protease-like protein